MKTIQCGHPPPHHNGSVYYALCFVYVEHSVCHEPISVLSNIYIYIYIYIYIQMTFNTHRQTQTHTHTHTYTHTQTFL